MTAEAEVSASQKQVEDLLRQIEELKVLNNGYLSDVDMWKRKYNNLQNKFNEQNKNLTALPKKAEEEIKLLQDQMTQMEKENKLQVDELRKIFEKSIEYERVIITFYYKIAYIMLFFKELREKDYNKRLEAEKRAMNSQVKGCKNENDQKEHKINVLTKENEELRSKNSDLTDESALLCNRYSLLDKKTKVQIADLTKKIEKLDHKVSNMLLIVFNISDYSNNREVYSMNSLRRRS